jgi:hypothetical protein
MSSRAIAVLKMSKRINNVVAFAQAVATAMNKNPLFPTPTPTMTTYEADLAALVAAESVAVTRAKGAAETRNAKLAAVVADLEALRTYVQGVVDVSPPANGVSIIESAGMSVRKVTLHDKAALVVKQDLTSGSVSLLAKAAKRPAAYSWEHSVDQKTWVAMPQTLEAKTSLSGLTAGTIYYFRVQVLSKAGDANWSQVVSLMVI